MVICDLWVLGMWVAMGWLMRLWIGLTGKRLWELCKEKYEPLWIKGGRHCNLELYPEYIRHLKKFISAIEKTCVVVIESTENSGLIDPPRISSDQMDHTSSSLEQRERSTPNSDPKEKPRLSVDRREKEKSRASIDRRDKVRKSIDRPEKGRNSIDHGEKPRNSIDRFGGMMRSAVLCNIGCFRRTTSTR
ncbi:hypothetical protein HPP92_020586 [Vanilla planifolia]|uniref:Uncharacterized protein n=1 Tax=Vanilla planifolia TaxID=51239 RepID=A0A835QB08_VANPL|nr:hypothetical protein HPP92_020586 [Vanilla planifolia]